MSGLTILLFLAALSFAFGAVVTGSEHGAYLATMLLCTAAICRAIERSPKGS